jgi:hypothetical protein
MREGSRGEPPCPLDEHHCVRRCVVGASCNARHCGNDMVGFIVVVRCINLFVCLGRRIV